MERDESASPPGRARGYPILLIALVTFTTGIATLGGSMLGAGIGRAAEGSRSPAGLFTGAVVGGVLGVALGVRLAGRLGAVPRSRAASWGAFIGGVLGFFAAAVIATRNLSGPWIPIASTLIVGIGAAVGSAVAARKARVG